MTGTLKRVLALCALAMAALIVCAAVPANAMAIDDDDTVYVTPHGKVYHLYKDCTGLNKASSIKETVYGKVGNRHLCEICAKRHGGGSSHSHSSGWQSSGGSWWYQHSDGSYPWDCWEKIGGSWYHFDEDGWMDTGWLRSDGEWYYLSTSGEMTVGWEKIRGTWYHFDSDGCMETGWLRSGGEWYHMSGSGAMHTGWQSIGKHWYCFAKSGAMYSDMWVGNYYLGSSGAMLTDCQTPDGNYVDENGKKIANKPKEPVEPTDPKEPTESAAPEVPAAA